MPHGLTKPGWPPGTLIASVLALVLQLAGATPASASRPAPPAQATTADHVAKGFCATIFADGIGHAGSSPSHPAGPFT